MRAKIPIFGTEETIERKIDISITEDIRRLLCIEKDNCNITFNEEGSNNKLKPKGFNGIHGNNTVSMFEIHVESDEEPQEDLALVRAPESRNGYNVFQDPEILVYFYPIKQYRMRTFTITVKHKSKAFINTLRDKLTLLPIQYKVSKIHKLEYHYVIPKQLIYMIDTFRKLKNNYSEEKLNLYEYITKYSMSGLAFQHTNPPYTYKTDVVCRESSNNVLGRFTNNLYEIKKSKDNSYYSLELQYEIYYEKPLMLIVEYPLMIFNQPIDQRYSKCFALPVDYTPRYGRWSKKWNHIYEFTNNINNYVISNKNFIVIPSMDKPLKITPEDGYRTICQTLLKVDDEYNVCNLFNIPGIKFKESFINFIKDNNETIGELYKNIFSISLYIDGKKDYNNKLIMDKDGNITSTFPLNKKHTYHLVIKALSNLNILTKEYKDKILDYFDNNFYQNSNNENNINKKEELITPSGNPFIKPKKYFVDMDYNLVDEENYICYIDGTRVMDEETKSFVLGNDKKLGVFNGDTKNEVYVDINGNFINPDGLAIDEEGKVLYDPDTNEPIYGDKPSYILLEDVVNEPEQISLYDQDIKNRYPRLIRNNLLTTYKQVNEDLFQSCLATDYLSVFGIDLKDDIFSRDLHLKKIKPTDVILKYTNNGSQKANILAFLETGIWRK